MMRKNASLLLVSPKVMEILERLCRFLNILHPNIFVIKIVPGIDSIMLASYCTDSFREIYSAITLAQGGLSQEINSSKIKKKVFKTAGSRKQSKTF